MNDVAVKVRDFVDFTPELKVLHAKRFECDSVKFSSQAHLVILVEPLLVL